MQMSVHDIQRLHNRHRALEHEIEALTRRPGYDELAVAGRKKEKLRINDQLAAVAETRTAAER